MLAARKKYASGVELLQEKRLDDAIRALEDALDIWPFYAEAKRQLAVSQKQRETAESLHETAAKLSEEGRWDETVQATSATLEVFPFHERALFLLALSKQKAAEAHCKAGKALLPEGKLQEAEKEFLLSLNYLPDMIDAKEGLAQADYIRGEAAGKKDLWGNALLWYMDAADHVSKNEYLNKIRQARSKIFERISFGLSLEVRKSEEVSPNASAALKSKIMQSISNQKPDFLLLVSGQEGARQPVYAISVDPAKVEIKSRLVSSENRTHNYTVYRDVPNPEIPKLRELLQVARQDLERLRREFDQTCPTCGGTGRLVCTKCGGRGEIRCTDCGGTGKWDCPECGGDGYVLDGVKCPKCDGSGKIRCVCCWGDGYATCDVCGGGIGKGKGYIRCTRCNGKGKATNVTEYDVRKKEADVQDIQRKLSREPAIVQKGFPAEWPYVEHYHEKTGLVEVGVSIRNLPTGTIVRADVVRKTTRDQDVTIQSANPSVGLDPDGLDLPSDNTVQTLLVNAAASEITIKLLDAVVKDRISHMRSEANELKQKGNILEATEAITNAARLIEPSNPSEAAQIIENLRTQERNFYFGASSPSDDSVSPK